MVQVVLVLAGIAAFVLLLAGCAAVNTNSDEADIEYWIKEHDRMERQKGDRNDGK